MACVYLAVIDSYAEEEFPFVVHVALRTVTQRGQDIIAWMETDEAVGRYVSVRGDNRCGFGVAFSDLATATAFRLKFV